MPARPPVEDGSATGGQSWADAPCGLVRLDERGAVVAANARFLDRTGYALGDLVGRSFWDELLAVGSRVVFQTQLAPILELDARLEEVMVDLRTAGGDRLPALLNAAREKDETGTTIGTSIAVMSVPDRRSYETELRRARNEAEQAFAGEAQGRLRLELLAQANTALASSVDVELAVGRLARTLTAQFADWCLIYVRDRDEPGVLGWSAAHAEVARTSLVERLAALLPVHARLGSPFSPDMVGGAPMLFTDVSEQRRRESTDSEEVLALFAALEPASAMVAACNARGRRLATLILVRQPGRAAFTDDDLAGLTDLAARTGIALDNLRRQTREHNNSIALQRALLTTPPRAPRLQIVTRYLPATTGNEVGGDWYDAFLQPDGTPVVVIGDVVGHDIHAAAAMGQLRGVIRTVGYTQPGTPADILTRADAAARGLGVDVLASALVARLETSANGLTTFRWSTAGHPPAILATADQIRALHSAPDRLLGLGPSLQRTRHDHQVALEPGDTVLLYTDGLIEQVAQDIDIGIMRLIDSIHRAGRRDLDELCDFVLTDRVAEGRDDVALLAIRLLNSPPPQT
jgi:PAS domain S-box-containing protein